MPVEREIFKALNGILFDKNFPIPLESWLYAVTVHVPDDNGVHERVTVFYLVDIGAGRTDIVFPLIDGYAEAKGISWFGKLPTETKEGGTPFLRLKFRQDTGADLEKVELNYLWRSIKVEQ